MTVDFLLENWARWNQSEGNALAAWYPPCSPIEGIALPFRRAPTTQEALDECNANQPIEDVWAERCEKWVQLLPLIQKLAIQAHYVPLPDMARDELGLTEERLDDWRARRVSRLGTVRVTVADYYTHLGNGIASLREALCA